MGVLTTYGYQKGGGGGGGFGLSNLVIGGDNELFGPSNNYMCFPVNNRRKAKFVNFKLQVMYMYFVKTNELRMDVYAYKFQHGNYTHCLMVAASQWVRTPTFEYSIMYMSLHVLIVI